MPDAYMKVLVVHQPGDTTRGVQIACGDFEITLPINDAMAFADVLYRAIQRAVELNGT